MTRPHCRHVLSSAKQDKHVGSRREFAPYEHWWSAPAALPCALVPGLRPGARDGHPSMSDEVLADVGPNGAGLNPILTAREIIQAA
jgi:hypothetical protein